MSYIGTINFINVLGSIKLNLDRNKEIYYSYMENIKKYHNIQVKIM